MSKQTEAALAEAIDAHIRDEFPSDHDTEHLTSWAIVGGYEDLDEPDRCSYSVDGSGKMHATVGLLGVGTSLLLNSDDD